VTSHIPPEYATLRESSNPIVSLPAVGAQDVLTSILRDGAQRLLTQAVEAEVAEWIETHQHCREQRCWVHKSANVLDKLPKRLQPEAKERLHQIWMAETRADAEQAFDLFLETYQAKYPKATECLAKDRSVLLTFYDFTAEH
jgi:transposase-like protein